MVNPMKFNSDKGGPSGTMLTGAFVELETGDSCGGNQDPSADSGVGIVTHLPGKGFGDIKTLTAGA